MFSIEIFNIDTDFRISVIDLPNTIKLSEIRGIMGGYVGDRSIGTTYPIFEEHQYFFEKYVGEMDFNEYDYFLNITDFFGPEPPMAKAY